MLKEIPNKPNHKIVGYKESCFINSFYTPIYERIFPLNTVYWDKSRNKRIYLVSDSRGCDCEGNFVEIDTSQLEIPSKVDQELFYVDLSHNGYEIKDEKLTIHPNYGNVYMTDMDVIVIYLANGCHTCTNEIVDYTPIRPADEFEIEAFFDSLKGNGFTYHPAHKCITASERYYYFPSYSLYAGFQPEKKKWIDSDADKFYDKHFEVFGTFNECADWCNIINDTLERGYPEIKLEE